MKLPWDRNWFKGCFYLIFTFTVIYIFKLIIDMCAYTLINVSGVAESALRSVKRIAGIFAPILISFAAAYVLKDPVELIKKHVKSRRTACLIVFMLLILPPVIIAGTVMLRLKQSGSGSIAQGISVWLAKCTKQFDIAYMQANELLERASLDGMVSPVLREFFNRYSVSGYTSGKIIKLAATCTLNFLLGMVMAFYLLVSDTPFSGASRVLRVLLPERLYRAGAVLLGDLDAVFSGYIKGQLTDGLIMSVLIGLSLKAAGIPFAAAIGIISGFSNIIPYFGSITGFLLTGAASLLSGEYIKIVYGFAVMLILQQIDSTVIVPAIMGKRVEISPFGVVAALAAGGKLFGIWGMVLAVPMAATGKIIILRAYERKLERLKSIQS